MNKKKVFMFSSVHRWDDTRVFHKMAVSLAKHYDIELHAPADFEKKTINGVKVIGLPRWEKKTDRIKVQILIFFRIMRSNAVIYHFHDPELILIGIFIRWVLRKSVIYDVHEDYPKQISSADWLPKLISKQIGNIIGFVEKVAFQVLNHFIVVTKPIQERFNSNKTTIIYNYPFIQNYKIKKKTNTIQLVYIGNLREDRGIKLLCQAFLNLVKQKKNVNIELVVAGQLSGSNQFNSDMRNIFNKDKIYYKGLIPYQEAMSIMLESHIGIIPSHYKSNYFEALPNKLFEYMHNELLVITTDIPLWESIVLGNNIGSTFKGESVDSLTSVLKKYCDNPTMISKKAKRGRELGIQNYSWQSEEQKLLNLYETLLMVS